MKFGSKRIVCTALVSSFLLGLAGCSQPNYTTFNLQHNTTATGINNGFTAAAAPAQIIIKKKKGVKSINLAGSRTLKSIKKLNVDVIAVPPTNSMKDMLAALRKNPSIEYAEPNYIRKIIKPRKSVKRNSVEAMGRKKQSTGINDPLRKEQYALDIVQAEKAWEITKGSSNVTVAVIDTGIDITHPDLKDKMVPGFSSIKGNSNGKDDNGHGTHVAGIIPASVNNKEGIAGMAPNCKLMPIKVLDEFGSGDDAGIIEGIIWAVDNGADIINMSLGGTGTSQSFEDAIQYAIDKKVAVIAAMGNDGENLKNYPAASKGVIAVGSSDSRDNPSDFTNFGDWITVAAPGTQILSTFPTYNVDLNNYGFPQNYATLDGTSMATPYVAGLAALVISKYGKITPAQLKTRLERGTDDLGAKGFDNYFGHGRINALKTLSN